ncbi:adhesion G protein-coupled receptor L3-like [Acanthaster planci]|uniref:Adhesion G protein-coupled receptor L3-like n=1 Tax=Acanthaster planci TaxID=133434 RepID=A0A8B7ZYF6_ACAPL|nr:adhesion G protein-coupled receptor L3-like [Acanthaster planci]
MVLVLLVTAVLTLPLTANQGLYNSIFTELDGITYQAQIPSLLSATSDPVLAVMSVYDAPNDEETLVVIGLDSDEPIRFGSAVVGLDVVTASRAYYADFNEFPIVVTFPRLQTSLDEGTQCISQTPDEMYWYSDGCQVTRTTNDDVACSCNQLANYAVLLQHKDTAGSIIMDPFTLLGLALSVSSLGVVLLTYKYSRQNTGQTVTHTSVSLSLVAFYTLHIFVDVENSSAITVLGILHGFFLQASFIWMALAGALFYLSSPTTSRIQPVSLLLTGWGGAAVVAMTSVAVSVCGYGTSIDGDSWMSRRYSLGWEFAVPILFIFVMKLFIGCRLTSKMRMHLNLNDNEAIQIRSGLGYVVTLEFIVCLLWVLRLFYSTQGNMFLANIIVTLNILQVFLVFHLGTVEDDDVSWYSSKFIQGRNEV